ncbi:MAG: hypothetical protein DWQ04_20080 [Chloroflexi bacterium]|nr:MAG: hypothetical protein DWQ04_20080 [Chloroflexota bacterium]
MLIVTGGEPTRDKPDVTSSDFLIDTIRINFMSPKNAKTLRFLPFEVLRLCMKLLISNLLKFIFVEA